MNKNKQTKNKIILCLNCNEIHSIQLQLKVIQIAYII